VTARYTPEYRSCGKVNDPADALSLRLYVDADYAGCRLTARSTNGGFLVLVGPNTFFPLSYVSKRQTCVSGSTTESEIVSLAFSLYQEALPALNFWEAALGRPMDLQVLEDNEATIKIIRKGYSPKMRHINRTHKVNLARLAEEFNADGSRVTVEYVNTSEQAADIFTKAVAPQKWSDALRMLNIWMKAPPLWKAKKANG
jgi:hypothetical protein